MGDEWTGQIVNSTPLIALQYDVPDSSARCNAKGALRLLEGVRKRSKNPAASLLAWAIWTDYADDVILIKVLDRTADEIPIGCEG